MPKVSIIVPVYNVEKYIRRCLDSIIAQTFTDWECLLIDDGSPDNSGKICDEYAKKDSRFRVFHKENGGVSSARNLGVQEASGEWIAFIDSDDIVLCNWLEVVCNAALRTQTDLVHWGYEKIDEEKSLETINIYSKEYDNMYDFILSKNYKHTVWSYLFRKKIITDNSICFPVGLKCSEDQSFLLKYMLVSKSVYCIPDILYQYYQNSESVTHLIIDNRYAFCNVSAAYDYLSFSAVKENRKEDFSKLAIRQLIVDTFFYLKKSIDYDAQIIQERFIHFVDQYNILTKNKDYLLIFVLKHVSIGYFVSVFLSKYWGVKRLLFNK